MGVLSTIAATYYSNSSAVSRLNQVELSPEPVAAIGVAMVAFWIIFMIIVLGFCYVLPSVFAMGLFKKAGVKPWAAWVPFYSSWKFFQIGGYPGGLIFIMVGAVALYLISLISVFAGVGGHSTGTMNSAWVGFSVLFVISLILFIAASIVFAVFRCLAAYQIGKKLGKDGAWVLLYIFVDIVWLGICGLDKSKWNDSKGKKRLDIVVKAKK